MKNLAFAFLISLGLPLLSPSLAYGACWGPGFTTKAGTTYWCDSICDDGSIGKCVPASNTSFNLGLEQPTAFHPNCVDASTAGMCGPGYTTTTHACPEGENRCVYIGDIVCE